MNKKINNGMRVKRVVLATGLALAMGGMSVPALAADADEIKLLKQQLETMQRRLDQLEKQQAPAAQATAPAAASGAALTAGSSKNSVMFPGGTELSWGGYAKLDAIYNSVSAGGSNNALNQVYVAGAIPLSNQENGRRNQLSMSGRESRLWFKTKTATPLGDATAHVEFDLYGAADDERTGNGNNLRTRHAYGSLGNLLAGQTWSTFLNLASVAETADLDGPASVILVRQAQVRYTIPFSGGNFQIAAENPESTLTAIGTVAGVAAGGRVMPSSDAAPDLIGRINLMRDWGTVSFAAMARQLRADGVVAGTSDSKWGGGVNVSGMIKLAGKDNFKFNATYGNAVGRYMGLNATNDGTITAAGKINTVNTWGVFGALQHWWTPTLRSNWALSTIRASNPAELSATAYNKSIWSSHLNLVWSATPSTTFAAEWLHANRKVENGLEGDLNRLQFSGKYEF